MALPSTETQRSRITSVYAALAAHNFSQLRQDAEFVDQLEALDLALVKELHPNLVEIERAYEAFRQDLVLYKLWERLHLYRALGEFRLGQREQIASQLFSAVTRHIMLATDACETARVDLFHFGDGIIIRYMLEDLQCDEFRELGLAEIKEKKESLVASTAAREIVILHNLLLCDEIAPQLVPMLEAGGVLEVIKLFLKSRDKRVKFWTLSLLGYLKCEEKVAALHIEDSLEFTVQFLVNTLNSKNAYEGAMLFEVLRNLCNLSEMKIHQEFLVKFGIISHLSRILRGKLIERLFWKTTESNDEYSSYEKYLATKCLYSYAIDSKHSKIIIADELLLEELLLINKKSLVRCPLPLETLSEERLLENETQRVFMALDIFINEEMRASHDGKLRDVITAIGNIKDHIRDQRTNRSTSDKNFSSQTLNGNGKHKQEVENVHPLPPIGHVFISYSIQNTKQAMQLKELLNQREIPVWIDKDTDRGNSIEAMVLGLNDARLVIMCLSDGYRQSESCKREAEYTVLKKKLFQPVIFQEGFRMEADWLCFVVGLQSWIDLSSEIQFQANKEMFVEQVQHMFHFGESVRITASVSATASSVVNSRIPFQLSLVDRPYKRRNEITMSPIDSPVIKAPKTDHSEAQDSIAAHVMNWNTDQVINWLDAEGLNNLKEKYA